MIVCVCKSITDREIEATIEAGETSFDGLQRNLGVGTQCGACSCEVKCLLKEIKQKQFQQCVARVNQSLKENGMVVAV